MEQQQILDYEKLFSQRFQAQLKDRNIKITLSVAPERVMATALLFNQDQSFYYPVEIMAVRGNVREPVEERVALLLDFAESYFAEFFADDEQVLLPLDWAPFVINDSEVFARGQIRNLYLENLADEYLEQQEDMSGPRH
jgi:hypothetical protein